MAWVDLLICYLFGIFGVHKFREKKIGMGILYLFTFGLFGIGWLYDCIKYLIIAIKSMSAAPKQNTEISEVNVNESFDGSKIIKHMKTFGLWYLSAFFIIIFLISIPNLTAFISLAIAVLIIPINKWQNIINKYIKHKVKIITIVGLIILTLISAVFYNSKNTDTNINDNSFTSSFTMNEEKDKPINSNNTTASNSSKAEHTHEYSGATCDKPETCSICGKTQGEPLSHNWGEATCESPRICTVCQKTEGEAIGHKWEEATCDKPETCSICGKTQGTIKEHSYYDGECSYCGISDPDYKSETMVWIPTNGGKKYHSRAGCSNMDNPEQVTQTEAESRGFTPCKRCH